MTELQQVVAALVLLINGGISVYAAYHAARARTAIEVHAIQAQGKDRVIADLVTVAGMEPQVASALAPLVNAVKAADVAIKGTGQATLASGPNQAMRDGTSTQPLNS